MKFMLKSFSVSRPPNHHTRNLAARGIFTQAGPAVRRRAAIERRHGRAQGGGERCVASDYSSACVDDDLDQFADLLLVEFAWI